MKTVSTVRKSVLTLCGAALAMGVLLLPQAELNAEENPHFFDAEPVGDGWYDSPTIGLFYPFSNHFWYHDDQGYMTVVRQSPGNLFAYQTGFGWLWISANHYPHLYRYDLDSWLYFSSRVEEWRWFYVYRFDQWHPYERFVNTEGFSYHWPNDAEEIFIDTEDEPDDPPVLMVSVPESANPGETVIFQMDGDAEATGTLFTGDGNRFSVDHTSTVQHDYDYPGEYTVTLQYAAPRQLPGEMSTTISVAEDTLEILVQSIRVEFYDAQQDILLGPSRLVIPPNFPTSDVAAVVHYTATADHTGTFEFHIESPDGTIASIGDVTVTLPATGGDEETVVIPSPDDLPLHLEGMHTVFVSTDLPRNEPWSQQVLASHANGYEMLEPASTTSGSGGPVTTGSTPAVYSHRSTIPELEEECEELGITLLMMQAELEAKLWDLEDLLSQLNRLREERAAKAAELDQLESERDAKEQAKQDAEDALDDAIDRFKNRYPDWELAFDSDEQSVEEAQTEMEGDLFPHLADSSSPELPTYYPSGDSGGVAAFPTASGYKSDVGIFFVRRNGEREFHFASEVREEFENRLDDVADARTELQEACEALEAAEDAVDTCQAELNALDAAIADILNQIADCEAAIASLRTDIESLTTHLDECEEQLRALLSDQESMRRDLRRARRALEHARAAVQRQRERAERARDEVDRRAGSPEELDAERDAIDEELDELDELDEQLDEMEEKLDEAEAKNEAGDPSGAETLHEEATTGIDNARSDTEDIAGEVRRKSREIRSRPERQCQDGDEKVGTWSSPRRVAVRVLDVAVAPAGATPEEWASRIERGRNVIGSIFDVFSTVEKIKDPVGAFKDWITGNATDAAKEALFEEDYPLGYDMQFIAGEIFDAWIRIFEGTTLIYIHVRLEGYTQQRRPHWICVDGLWERQPDQTRIVDDPIQWTEVVNTPVHAFSEEERKEQIAEVLARWLQIKGLLPPSGD